MLITEMSTSQMFVREADQQHKIKSSHRKQAIDRLDLVLIPGKTYKTHTSVGHKKIISSKLFSNKNAFQ